MMQKPKGRKVAVRTVKVYYCDKCSSDVDVDRFIVTFPGGNRRSFDLCADCAEPLRELEGLLEKVRERGPKRYQQPVLTPKQVEGAVRKARKSRSVGR